MNVLDAEFEVKEEIRIDVVNTIEETKESDWSANFPNTTFGLALKSGR